MAIGKISGTMLQANLERQGTNISIDATAYFDVNNFRLGVNTLSPQYTLDINGNAHVGNLYILGNTISTDVNKKLNLGNIANIQITGGAPDYIIYTDGLGNLNFANLSVLAGLDGFSGNNITLGSNTVGVLAGNAGSLTTVTTVTDSIALLNQILGNITNSTGSIIHVSGNVTANAHYGNLFGNVTALGNISASNVIASGTHYGNISADIITPYQTQTTVFNSTAAVGLPVGSSAQYPAGNIAGYLRFNSTISTLEFYNGSYWVPLTNSIGDQTITPDGVSQSFSLSQASTANGVLVSINGTVQRPGVAYTVSGSTITFSEVPTVTDIIDVRFIASAISTSLDVEVVDTGNVQIGTATSIIDSFSSAQYRSAKYTISSSDGADAQFSDIMLVQNNGTVAVNTIYVSTGGNSVTYSANVNGTVVNLLANSTVSNTQLRIQRTYFNV
jgi:hypothetical protein